MLPNLSTFTQETQSWLNENQTPLAPLIDQLIEEATKTNASDIHIEPFDQQYRIRIRQDGVLHEKTVCSTSLAKKLIVSLKTMAKMDIAEQRLPQDGQCNIALHNDHQSIDLRLSCCPTINGEKMVLRLLGGNHIQTLDQLELNTNEKTLLLNAIHQPNGLILVTGPTGSGKTTTLYAALNHIHSIEKNTMTIEDPIERDLPGIHQVTVNPKINLTFSRALRAFLRQDPDIILIGEIRDTETAEIALKAAQTGHLVLSTLHADHTYDAFLRLYHLGINPYHLLLTTRLIVSQRLIRKLCPHCKKVYRADPDFNSNAETEFQETDVNKTLFRAIGCSFCQNGYHGRKAIYEMLPIHSETVINNIAEQKNDTNLSTILSDLKKQVSCHLYQSAMHQVILGETSLEEIQRVLGKREHT